MTTRYERLKMQRRLQRQIRLVVEERRMSQLRAAERPIEPDPVPAGAGAAQPGEMPGEATVEIPPALLPLPMPPAVRAIGRVAVRSA